MKPLTEQLNLNILPVDELAQIVEIKEGSLIPECVGLKLEMADGREVSMVQAPHMGGLIEVAVRKDDKFESEMIQGGGEVQELSPAAAVRFVGRVARAVRQGR